MDTTPDDAHAFELQAIEKADDATVDFDHGSIGHIQVEMADDGSPLNWNDLTRWVPQEVLDARPEAVVAGRYVRIGRKPIGKGSHGEVWKAYDKRLQRWVALKIVGASNERARSAVVAEAKTVGGLRHAHIAQLLDAGDIDGWASYLAMEYIDGDTLETRVGGPVRESVRLLRDAALAVHEAHERGFIHRDLKPRNMMFERTRPEHVFVLDFGVARWIPSPRGESEHRPVGTLAYMAPEQASGGVVDARSDVYGLGTTLYHLLAGRFYPSLADGDSWLTMARKVVEDTGPPASSLNADVDTDLDAILARALCKPPDERYETALDFADALSAWIDARSRPSGGPARPGLIAGRYRTLEVLAQGGFANLYVALDIRTSARVVLKQLRHRSPKLRRMALRGAQIQAQATHPFIVPVFDIGEDDAGVPFSVLRWLPEAHQLDSRLPIPTRVRLVRDAAVALHQIHEMGYFRLDIKPANTLVTGEPPVILLTDFDTAIHVDDLHDEKSIVGTPQVMSPEQVGSGATLDHRTDIFSLGATLYYAIAGRYPVNPPTYDAQSGEGLADLIATLLEDKLVDVCTIAPETDRELGEIVMRCLAFDPGNRPPSMAALADALSAWLDEHGTVARPHPGTPLPPLVA